MSPLEERHAAMDDMADHAQRFAPIRIQSPGHPPVRRLPAHLATTVSTRRDLSVIELGTPELLAEVDDGLALRVCRRQTTARDVLLVQALTDRLRTAPVRGREPLEGMLLIDIPDEREAAAPTLRFDGFERRVR